MTQEELIALLEKANITTVTTGGLLNTEQANRFIETTLSQSAFLSSMRKETGIGTARDLDTMGVGTRLLHAPATEITAPTGDQIKGVTTGKRTLTPVEVMLPYNISLRYLEENIGKAGVEDQINKMFGLQFANDLVDLFVNGDALLTGDTFLGITDGMFATILLDANKNYYNRTGSTDWKGSVLPGLLKALPEKYKVNPQNLVFLTSFDLEQEYREQLADRATALGDAYLTEKRSAQFKGINLEPVPTFPYGKILLTVKQNHAVGFGREITVYKQFQPRERLVEYTITAKIDYNYVLSDLNVYTV